MFMAGFRAPAGGVNTLPECLCCSLRVWGLSHCLPSRSFHLRLPALASRHSPHSTSDPKSLELSPRSDLAAGSGFSRMSHLTFPSLCFVICEMGRAAPSAWVAGGTEGATAVSTGRKNGQ